MGAWELRKRAAMADPDSDPFYDEVCRVVGSLV